MSEPRAFAPIGSKRDAQQSAWTLARAFQDDPGLSYVLPNPDARLRVLPRFFSVMIEQSLRHGTATAAGNFEAASLWYPPGVITDRRRVRWWDDLRLAGLFKSAIGRGIRVAEAMHAHHPDPQPYDYLRYVGACPGSQGKGWGGAIVRDGVARAAAKGRGVLLETATESNVSIYTRLGFAIHSEWSVPGGGPKFWTMVHPAP